MQIEKRCLVPPGSLEIRTKDDGSKVLEGYAMKWEQLSVPLGSWYKFREKISKNAFSESIKKDDIKALWSHDTSKVLGRTKNNTVQLIEDDVGLRFTIDLPNTTLGNDSFESVRRGDVDGVSFGFTADIIEWDESNQDEVIRTIKSGQLFEISPVAFPAYEGVSEIEARSIDEEFKKYKQKNEGNKPFFDAENQRRKIELILKEATY